MVVMAPFAAYPRPGLLACCAHLLVQRASVPRECVCQDLILGSGDGEVKGVHAHVSRAQKCHDRPGVETATEEPEGARVALKSPHYRGRESVVERTRRLRFGAPRGRERVLSLVLSAVDGRVGQ